jgi:hypothetical protein
MTEFATIPMFQALATAIAAVGSGVLLAGFMTGHVDGEGKIMTNLSCLIYHASRLIHSSRHEVVISGMLNHIRVACCEFRHYCCSADECCWQDAWQIIWMGRVRG